MNQSINPSWLCWITQIKFQQNISCCCGQSSLHWVQQSTFSARSKRCKKQQMRHTLCSTFCIKISDCETWKNQGNAQEQSNLKWVQDLLVTRVYRISHCKWLVRENKWTTSNPSSSGLSDAQRATVTSLQNLPPSQPKDFLTEDWWALHSSQSRHGPGL